MEAWTLTLLSVAGVSLMSLVGAVGLSFKSIGRHGVMMFLVALAAGTLIGDTFLHLLPEASHDGFTPRLALLVVGGFLVMFVLEVVLRLRHAHAELVDSEHAHNVQPFGVLNLVTDAVHNFLDGVIIAAAYLVDTQIGLATTLAVLLHEVPQELGDFAVLVRSGFSPAKALVLNLGSAAIAFLGAILVLLLDADTEAMQAIALPLVAGGFIYIAAADLIPELHHHTKGREQGIVLAGFVVGVALMWGLTGLEAGTGHEH